MPPPAAPPRRRRGALPVVVAVVAALVVVAGAVVVPLVVLGDDDDRPSDRSPSASGSDEEEVDTSNLDLVEEYDDLDPSHVTEDVDYPQVPPVGGPHWAEWLECGVYDHPVPDENAVHDLEHGTVWITYRDDLVDDAGVEALGEQLPTNGILSPHPDQEAPVVVTVWGRQLALLGPDDPRLALFVEEYGAGETAPEPWASCAGGTAAADGVVV
ncbi:DUF3105 domain-containing protein [Nocardioides sp. TF02-7]|uniref:DUF3105 domain-containing protein n=1 Tax=Nocardioides sp. TF02-7 TaxID=2917724 RepID=UPI001F05845D|nr:DUF3105 domain-containing protein [Nocardioides sp. TF02-7]UMG92288.1 DUF3105 domain-containing protein [Nocardioides sp. TF02-7]